MSKTVAAWLMIASALATPATGPGEVVQGAVDRVIALLTDAEPARPPAAPGARPTPLAEIRRVAFELFDLEEMARRTLPRHWADLNAEDRTEFVGLFGDLLERTYLGRLEAYAGERIVYTGQRVDGRHATVRSRVVFHRRGETSLDYRLHLAEGRWRVYDLVVDGVSFVATYRVQFQRVVGEGSYAALRDRLRQRGLQPIAVGQGL